MYIIAGNVNTTSLLHKMTTPEQMGMYKVGSYPKLIKQLYDTLVEEHKGVALGVPNEHIEKVEQELLSEIPEGFKYVDHGRSLRGCSSMFFVNRAFSGGGRTDDWHSDGGGSYAMMIASWPNPTEIVLGIKDEGMFNEEWVTNSLNKGKAKIFVPKKGDLWFLPPRILHRTNPKAKGQPHLVVRRWYERKRG